MSFTASEWVEIIKALTAGAKDLILAVAAVATIWIQNQNAGKIDTAAAKAEVAAVKAADADATAASNYAITSQWRAEHTGTAEDKAKAAEAQNKLEKMP